MTSPRLPGQHVRYTALRLRMRALLTLGLFAILTGATGRAFGLHNLAFEVAEIALLVVCFSVSRWIVPQVARRERGAAAEEHVGAILDGLARGGWEVLHDVPLRRSNVDHVLVGPAGVFTVETKSHPGPIRVHDLHPAIIHQARRERDAVRALVDVPVQALVVYSRAWVDHPGRRRGGVSVLPARMLSGWLHGRAPELAAEDVERIAQALRGAFGEGIGFADPCAAWR